MYDFYPSKKSQSLHASYTLENPLVPGTGRKKQKKLPTNRRETTLPKTIQIYPIVANLQSQIYSGFYEYKNSRLTIIHTEFQKGKTQQYHSLLGKTASTKFSSREYTRAQSRGGTSLFLFISVRWLSTGECCSKRPVQRSRRTASRCVRRFLCEWCGALQAVDLTPLNFCIFYDNSDR